MNALLFVADVERNEYIQAQQEHEVMCSILRKATTHTVPSLRGITAAPNRDVKRMLQIIIDVSGYQVTDLETRAMCPNPHCYINDNRA
jgi:hypothetical protein